MIGLRISGLAGLAGLAVAASTGACFRGDFLANTCEQLGGCAGETDVLSTSSTSATDATSATSATTELSEPTTSSSGTTGAARVELPYMAMRIDSLSFADPDLYASFLGPGNCTNVRKTLAGLLNGEIASGESSIVFAATNYSPDADQFNFVAYQNPLCDVLLGECTIGPAELPPMLPALNVDAGECIAVDTTTMNQLNVPELVLPSAPCFRTPVGSFSIKLSDKLGFIALTEFHMSAAFLPDDQDPSEFGSGVIHGFIRQDEAEKINYDLMGMPINLWSLIAGSGHPAECATAKGYPSDVDTIDLTGPMGVPDGVPETAGIWLFINFTAQRIRLFAEV